jgi:hypothetical protein
MKMAHLNTSGAAGAKQRGRDADFFASVRAANRAGAIFAD